jgi:hypothetical protein
MQMAVKTMALEPFSRLHMRNQYTLGLLLFVRLLTLEQVVKLSGGLTRKAIRRRLLFVAFSLSFVPTTEPAGTVTLKKETFEGLSEFLSSSYRYGLWTQARITTPP